MTLLNLTGLAIALAIIVAFIRVCAAEFNYNRVPILLYHRLRPKDSGTSDWEPIFVVYASEFSKQMEYLVSMGYNVISLNYFHDCMQKKSVLPPKSVIITFDDGYLSTYQYAYPVLKKLSFPATIFVTVDKSSNVFDDRKDYDLPLSDEQIKEMSESGISIQSHSMTHRPLTQLSDEEVRWELLESKKVIKSFTGESVDFLAVPGAFHDKRVKKIAKDVGYVAAFFGHKGTNNIKTDPFMLRRLVVERDFTIKDFAKSLRPWAACQWRIIGFLKSLPAMLLGAQATAKLRRALYRTKFGHFFTFRTFRKVLLIYLILFLVFIGLYVGIHSSMR